ncbi:MAG: DDE-type integrase/transposase/recombinase, partial [Campylobacterota bacterium]|nr:DDE-type integrase/transposase/recombinase [Campylobacterota bacterium]
MRVKTGIDKMQLISMIDISSSKYYYWLKHKGEPLRHNGNMPRSHYLLPEEREKIITYKKLHPELGYRKLTWQMVDENIVYVSPPTVYRVLRKAHLNTMFTREGGAKHPKGFVQPEKPHEQWHIDISYINVFGTFMFLISVLDGYSRYILSWDLRTTMETFDVEMVLQKALEEYRNENPRVITDNGGQFISKEFKNYLRFVGIKHSRTRVNHPQ